MNIENAIIILGASSGCLVEKLRLLHTVETSLKEHRQIPKSQLMP